MASATETPDRVFTPAAIPMAARAPVTPANADRLRASAIYHVREADNRTPLEQLLQRDLPNKPWPEFWVALVPGSSEANGHHRAWVPKSPDDTLVEPEYCARLRHAYRLLDAGIVSYVMVSGGSIDDAAPDYNEGLRGRQQLLDECAGAFASSPSSGGDALASRVIVDPFAIHSVSNVRNADRVAAFLGLDRLLVVTTSGFAKQGWWLTNDPLIGSFNSACNSQLGYRLGTFTQLDPGPDGGNIFGTGARDGAPPQPFATEVILHWNVNPQVMTDGNWS